LSSLGELFSALPSVGVWNPAFDVTPANLITGSHYSSLNVVGLKFME